MTENEKILKELQKTRLKVSNLQSQLEEHRNKCVMDAPAPEMNLEEVKRYAELRTGFDKEVNDLKHQLAFIKGEILRVLDQIKY
jgi:hypothetical protein